jgi:hypothetical protein
VSNPAEFVALTVKLNVPAVVDVPEIIPALPFKLTPVGRLPLVMDHVIGAAPVAVSVRLYPVPTLPGGREDVVITGAAAEVATLILRFLVSDPVEFVALTAKLNVPAVFRVPEIVPEFVFKPKPVGRLPLVTDQIIGAIPIAASV